MATNKNKYKQKKKKKTTKEEEFFQKEVNIYDSLLFPSGYEFILSIVYFLTLPYLTGILFISFVIGRLDLDIFSVLVGEDTFMVAWIIGYEILAGIALLYIFRLMLKSFNDGGGSGKNGFVYVTK